MLKRSAPPPLPRWNSARTALTRVGLQRGMHPAVGDRVHWFQCLLQGVRRQWAAGSMFSEVWRGRIPILRCAIMAVQSKSPSLTAMTTERAPVKGPRGTKPRPDDYYALFSANTASLAQLYLGTYVR